MRHFFPLGLEIWVAMASTCGIESMSRLIE